jgi:hypothetical protein
MRAHFQLQVGFELPTIPEIAEAAKEPAHEEAPRNLARSARIRVP